MQDIWIPVSIIESLLKVETFAIMWSILPLSFLFYKAFLKKITEKRHANLRQRFSKTTLYLAITSAFSGSHWVIFENAYHSSNEYFLVKVSSYLALIALIFGVISVVKLAQILVYLYLFLMNMSVGVPRLIANIFTLAFSIALISWILADIFGFHLAAVLATSAVFSLVLGLALQDTLGNLFSGLALQIDRPFQIGDWIEIQFEGEKWTGVVHEVSWRATTLVSFADETILIPNRIMAQGQLINYSHSQRPARQNHTFRFQFNVSIEEAKNALMEGIANIPEIVQDPPPRTLIMEVTESWITIKVFYSLRDFGTRYRTGDLAQTQILEQIKKRGLKLATPLISVTRSENFSESDL